MVFHTSPPPPPESLVLPDLADAARWGGNAAQWQAILGKHRLFRLRGLTHFGTAVPGYTATQLIGIMGQMQAWRATLPGWNPGGLWDESFAGAQINAALRGEPLRFDKAAKALLCCEVLARLNGVAANSLLKSMRLEPAVFYVLNFETPETSGTPGGNINPADPWRALVSRVANRCGQPLTVINGMATGDTVSYRLAAMVRQALLAEAFPAGPVQVKWQAPRAQAKEIIDGPSDLTDVEAAARLREA